MPAALFTATVIAIIWDFDQTLIPGYQQDPLFDEYRIDPKDFWDEVNALEGHYQHQGLVVSRDTLYLNHILTYVKDGHMPGLTNQKLKELGAKLTFYPGIPEFLDTFHEFRNARRRVHAGTLRQHRRRDEVIRK